VEFVPKNWKTHRTIACEPEGNVPLQLAFDDYAKEILRKWGINLSDQSLNQDLAREGSISGEYATIDLKSASDSVAKSLISWVIPSDWAGYLFRLRCPYYRLPDGSRDVYEKFSSMGNGSTFPLETLIFVSACRAIGSKAYAVYGDDIILETELVPDLLRLLSFLGFDVNKEKSFTAGPFRESCGGDYFNGIDITPFYLRKLNEQRGNLCHLVNGLARIGTTGGEVWEIAKALVKEFGLPYVPFNQDTRSGVFVDATTAYQLRLVRSFLRKRGDCIPSFRSYVSKEQTRLSRGDRTYVLWWLAKARASKSRALTGPIDNFELPPAFVRLRLGDPVEATVTTEVPTLVVKTKRQWVRWVIPPAAPRPWLYAWTDHLVA
jgi:hypothetical protein